MSTLRTTPIPWIHSLRSLNAHFHFYGWYEFIETVSISRKRHHSRSEYFGGRTYQISDQLLITWHDSLPLFRCRVLVGSAEDAVGVECVGTSAWKVGDRCRRVSFSFGEGAWGRTDGRGRCSGCRSGTGAGDENSRVGRSEIQE